MSNNIWNRWTAAQSCVCSADKGCIQFTSDLRGTFRGELCLCGANWFFVWMRHSRSLPRQLLKAFKGCSEMSQPSLSWPPSLFFALWLPGEVKKTEKQTNQQTNQEHEPHRLTCGEGYSEPTKPARFRGSNWSGLHGHCESNGGENESVI